MSAELASPLSASRRRRAQIEMIGVRERQIAQLQAEQRRAVAALVSAPGGAGERFVADELALVWARSPRQAQHRVAQALAFATFPAVHALVGTGGWLLDHADAVIQELAASGLDDTAQAQVLALVLSRPGQHTPYELRVAVRTAVLALFPSHAWEHAQRARTDRDVSSYPAGPGAAQLIAYGPVEQVAAMLASIDALCWPVAPEDRRSLPQRRFDAIKQLVCGQAQPGQWQVQVITELTTVRGTDDHPAEIVGFGPVPAAVARAAASSGQLRRVIIDQHGRLVTVETTVHRPDLPQPPTTVPFPVHVTDDNHPEPDEPDPDAPTAEDLTWYEQHTDHTAHPPQPPHPTAPLPEPGLSPLELHAHPLHPDPQPAAGSTPGTSHPQPPTQDPLLPARWSPDGLTRALHHLQTDPLTTPDLASTRYQVPRRLKRHLVLRDRTCAFPGCPRPAEHCDSDHLTPWPLGPITETNLANECEHHHQAKHNGFDVQRLPDGTYRWTTPSGHTYDRPPRPVLDTHPHRPPPQQPQEPPQQ